MTDVRFLGGGRVRARCPYCDQGMALEEHGSGDDARMVHPAARNVQCYRHGLYPSQISPDPEEQLDLETAGEMGTFLSTVVRHPLTPADVREHIRTVAEKAARVHAGGSTDEQRAAIVELGELYLRLLRLGHVVQLAVERSGRPDSGSGSVDGHAPE